MKEEPKKNEADGGQGNEGDQEGRRRSNSSIGGRDVMRTSVEEYVEIIDDLERDGGRARTTELARRLGIKPASVTEFLRKLDAMGLVEYMPYQGAKLTEEGRSLADELSRKHRTLSEFLAMIGVGTDESELDACRIEHHVTPETVERLRCFITYVQESQDSKKFMEKFKRSCNGQDDDACNGQDDDACKKGQGDQG